MNPEILNTNVDNSKKNSFKEIIRFTFFALIIILPIRMYIAEPFVVKGPSMDPTFATGQYLIVDLLTYNFRDIERGDVIVFKHPIAQYDKYLIKRVVALPNETIAMDNGKITISNKENEKGFIFEDSHVLDTNKTRDTFKKTLAHDEYFVMGDNRINSSDSREWGALESEYIVGRPLFRLFPFSKISFLPGIK